MLHRGIEKRFQVDAAFAFAPVFAYAEVPTQSRFAVERVGGNGCLQTEVEFLRNFFQRRVKQHGAVIQNDNGIDKILQVSHLMCGNYRAGVI